MSFELYLSNRKDIRLSRSQEKLVKSISTFLSEPKGPQCFILRGAAGSGKTFIGSLIKEYSSQGTYIFTPTGRAAKVFRSMVRSENDRQNISTIHHGIYTHAKDERKYVPGKPKKPNYLERLTSIFKLRENLNSNDALYICDEASMISDFQSFTENLEFGTGCLLSDLFDHIGTRKVIFIGDHAQLTPINMEHSPALSKSYIEDKFNVDVINFELKEILRQNQDSGIVRNATKIRNEILEKKERNIVPITPKSDVSFIQYDNVLEIANDSFNPNKFTDFTIITHTRKLSREYNFAVRKKLFPDAKSKLIVNDRILCSQTNYLHQIFNGELMRITKVFTDEGARISRTLELSPTKREKKYSEINIQSNGKMSIELTWQKVELEYHDNKGKKASIACYVLENGLTNHSLGLDMAEGRALLIDFIMRREKSKQKYLSDNNKKYLSEYEEKSVEKSGDIIVETKDIFLNGLVIKYGYALTAHKAQGGEWDKAIVDLSTKHWDKASEEALRWKYTAITRPKKNLYLVEEKTEFKSSSIPKNLDENDTSDSGLNKVVMDGRIKEPGQENAYTKWEVEDEVRLQDSLGSLLLQFGSPSYESDKATEEYRKIITIAAEMKRGYGAIVSRMRKIKLINEEIYHLLIEKHRKEESVEKQIELTLHQKK